MIPTATQLVHFAAEHAGRAFRKFGTVAPIWHAVTGKGENVVLAPQEMGGGRDKDIQSAVLREMFREIDAVAVVFVCESWILTGKEDLLMPSSRRGGISGHPRRQECVWFQAEDANGSVTAVQMIDRPAGRPARLLPLKVHEATTHMEGRFVGMLPTRGKGH